MIKVKYSYKNSHYVSLNVKGHAEFSEEGKDLVCASTSSIMFGLMNALDELDKKIDIEELDNEINITNDSKNSKADDYIELTIYQLKTLEESYKRFIKVERK